MLLHDATNVGQVPGPSDFCSVVEALLIPNAFKFSVVITLRVMTVVQAARLLLYRRAACTTKKSQPLRVMFRRRRIFDSIPRRINVFFLDAADAPIRLRRNITRSVMTTLSHASILSFWRDARRANRSTRQGEDAKCCTKMPRRGSNLVESNKWLVRAWCARGKG